MREIDVVSVHPETAAEAAAVYEHGWQSWSPSGTYRLGVHPPRPRSENNRVMNWRADTHPPPDIFWGEGLLAVDAGDGSGVVVFAAPVGADPVPSIRAEVRGTAVVVSATGPVDRLVDPQAFSIDDALGRWARDHAKAAGVSLRPHAPSVWCSWYQYFHDVTDEDIFDNVAAMDELGLDVDVVQIDDGYQAEIGDWLVGSDRFHSLQSAVTRVRDSGRRAGIWVAPFLVSPRSATFRDHIEWTLADTSAGWNWGAEQAVLDVTHPQAEAYLRTVFETFHRMGIDYFKIDFAYAGALAGSRADRDVTPQAAYRRGLGVIRESIGDSYLVGCGAPILPSMGLVDAMRVSPDTAPHYEPTDGDLSSPS